MKNTIKFIALIITVICIVGILPVSALDVIGETVNEYNTYGSICYLQSKKTQRQKPLCLFVLSSRK